MKIAEALTKIKDKRDEHTQLQTYELVVFVPEASERPAVEIVLNKMGILLNEIATLKERIAASNAHYRITVNEQEYTLLQARLALDVMREQHSALTRVYQSIRSESGKFPVQRRFDTTVPEVIRNNFASLEAIKESVEDTKRQIRALESELASANWRFELL